MFSSKRLHELESMMEQHVLLDDCSQPHFKKLISDQIMMIRRNGVENYQEGPTTIAPDIYHNLYPSSTSVETVGTLDSEWVGDVNEWGTAQLDSEWGSEQAVNEPTIGVQYKINVQYNIGQLKCFSREPNVQRHHRHHHRRSKEPNVNNQLKEEICIKFEKKVKPETDSWCEVKTPGVFSIGLLNLYMKEYLYFDSNKSEYIISEIERDHEYLTKVSGPIKIGPPIAPCKIAEGCSFRRIVGEGYEERLKKYSNLRPNINLRKDVNNWNIYSNDNDSCIDVAGYFDMNNRMILTYDDISLDELEDYDFQCYLDGRWNSFIDAWTGYVYGYDNDVCTIIGSFEMRKMV